jgi:hypothetical protein
VGWMLAAPTHQAAPAHDSMQEGMALAHEALTCCCDAGLSLRGKMSCAPVSVSILFLASPPLPMSMGNSSASHATRTLNLSPSCRGRAMHHAVRFFLIHRVRWWGWHVRAGIQEGAF